MTTSRTQTSRYQSPQWLQQARLSLCTNVEAIQWLNSLFSIPFFIGSQLVASEVPINDLGNSLPVFPKMFVSRPNKFSPPIQLDSDTGLIYIVFHKLVDIQVRCVQGRAELDSCEVERTLTRTVVIARTRDDQGSLPFFTRKLFTSPQHDGIIGSPPLLHTLHPIPTTGGSKSGQRDRTWL